MKAEVDDKALREKIHNGLVNLVNITLEDKDVGPDLHKLMETFRISKEELTKEVLAYTLGKGVDEYENKHYQNLAARLTLYFHNVVKETYHRKRQEIILNFLRKVNPKHIIDVGYGTPAPYLLEYMSENKEMTATLADQDPSANEFAKEIIKNKNPEFLNRINFKVYDMDAQEYPEDADVYLYLDSIEHTNNPTEYFHKITAQMPKGSHFILSMPVCSMKGLENFHYDEWLTDEESREWIREGGLEIIAEDVVYPNMKVDFFAELVEGGYHNHLVLAKKV
jgi:SAM-dependent methyltransferase